jgi:hypothetical protein
MGAGVRGAQSFEDAPGLLWVSGREKAYSRSANPTKKPPSGVLARPASGFLPLLPSGSVNSSDEIL